MRSMGLLWCFRGAGGLRLPRPLAGDFFMPAQSQGAFAGSRAAKSRKRLSPRCLTVILLTASAALAQQPQNPSPMVEHTRAHQRLREETPPGRREKLDLGTLFVPAGVKARNGVAVLFF